MSNSLKFTNKGGQLTVIVKILETQAKATQEHNKRLKEIVRKQMSFDPNVSLQDISCIVNDSNADDQLKASDKNERFIHLQLTIRDNGVGMKPEDLNNLFIDFGKLEDKAGRNKSGTGLGLSICKQIIDQMGGSVKVSSELGKGTDFVISMKEQCRVSEHSASAPKAKQKCKKGLSGDNQAEAEFEFISAMSNVSLVNVVKLKKSVQPEHVFCEAKVKDFRQCLDSQQKMNLNRMKELLQSHQPQQQMDSLSPPKLISSPSFDRFSFGIVQIQNEEEAKVHEPPILNVENLDENNERQFRCLIANDEHLQLTVLEALFEKNGFAVETAINGHEAFEQFQAALICPRKRFDLVVLDLSMPVTDGFEACKQIQKTLQSKQVIAVKSTCHKDLSKINIMGSSSKDFEPLIIAVTGFVDGDVKQKCDEAGFDMLFEAPLSFEEIRETIVGRLVSREERMKQISSIASIYDNI